MTAQTPSRGELKAWTQRIFNESGEGQASLSQSLKSIASELLDAMYGGDVTESDLDSVRNTVTMPSDFLPELRACFQAWASMPQGDSTSTTNFWIMLVENGVSYRALILYLHALVKSQDKQALVAGAAMLDLLCIPGNANVFNTIAMRSTMNLLKLWAKFNQDNPSKGKKGKKQVDSDDEENPFEDDEEPEHFDWLKDSSLHKSVLDLLGACGRMLSHVSLDRHPEAMTHAMEALIDVSRAKPKSKLSASCFQTLTALLESLPDEKVDMSFHLLLKMLLPSILMTYRPLQSSAVPKICQNVRKDTIKFVGSVASQPSRQQHVLRLLQHLCVRAPDKAEYKRAVVDSVTQLCLCFPALVLKVAQFLKRLSRNTKASLRATAVDVAAELLHHAELVAYKCDAKESPEVQEEDDAVLLPVIPLAPSQARILMALLISRCSDKGATVRAKALASLSEVLELSLENETIKAQFALVLKEGATWATPATMETPDVMNTATPTVCPSPLDALNATSGSLDLSMVSAAMSPGSFAPAGAASGFRQIVAILRLRSTDERPLVRKAAINALLAIFLLQNKDEDPDSEPLWKPEDLQVFFDGCMDNSPALRKKSMEALSLLHARHPSNIGLAKAWLGAIVPLARDCEAAVQADSLKHIKEYVLTPVMAAIKRKEDDAPIWAMLACVDDEMARCVKYALSLMIRRQQFPTGLVNSLNRLAPTDTHIGLWLLLEVVTTHMPDKCDVGALLKAWDVCKAASSRKKKATDDDDTTELRTVKVLQCLSNVSANLPMSPSASLASYLFNCLSNFDVTCPPELVKAMVQTMKAVCGSLEAQQEGVSGDKRIPVPAWEKELMKLCMSGLESYVFRTDHQPTDDDSVIRFLFLVGELVLHTTVEVPPMVRTLIQSLISPYLSADLAPKNTGAVTPTVRQRAGDIEVPTNLRAHAFIALGKLCLRSEALAKQLMPTMVGELQDGTSPVIQNNILIIMCDFSRTFSAVVDNYIPSLTYCLKSSNDVVRKHTLMILKQLLQEDYLKWKSSLFFRILTTTVDNSPDVRMLGQQVFRSTVLLKAPNKFYMHFIETIFFLNACTSHSTYNQFNLEQDSAFALSQSPRRRQSIYKFLIGFMNDVQKFQTSAKLCEQVLGAVVEGTLSLDKRDVFDVVEDSLNILACNDIKIKGARNASDIDEDVEQMNLSDKDKKALAAKGKFLSKLSKKNTLENIVPIVIELKRILEKKQSSLIRPLMVYLGELMKDYKQELEDVLATDRQLMTEIQYDLRQFAQQQKAAENKQELRRLSMTPVSATTMSTPRSSLGRRRSSLRKSMSKPRTGTLRRSQSMGVSKTPRKVTPKSSLGSIGAPVFATPRLSSKKPKQSPRSGSFTPVLPLMERSRSLPEVGQLTERKEGEAQTKLVFMETPDKAPPSSVWNVAPPQTPTRDQENLGVKMSKMVVSTGKKRRREAAF